MLKTNIFHVRKKWSICLILLLLEMKNQGLCAPVKGSNIPVKYLAPGSYLSPDKKYLAIVTKSDVENPGILKIIKLKFLKNRSRTILSRKFYPSSAISFVWLPRRAHSFLFAAKTTQGKAYISYWNGGNIYYLKQGHLPPHEDPDDEYFRIVSVDLMGKYVIFTHYYNPSFVKEGVAEKMEKIKKRLNLPKIAESSFGR